MQQPEIPQMPPAMKKHGKTRAFEMLWVHLIERMNWKIDRLIH